MLAIAVNPDYTYLVVKGAYFNAQTPFGIAVRTTKEYWQKIISIKHPSVKQFEKEAIKALESPDQIRRSKQDPRVHLYYKSLGKLFICIVADHMNAKEGYIITAYLTDRIKEGEQIYVKS